jgi:hypothetical protein
VFSVLLHLHTNIYEHSWKWLVINLCHQIDVHLLSIYAGFDSLKLVFRNRQQSLSVLVHFYHGDNALLLLGSVSNNGVHPRGMETTHAFLLGHVSDRTTGADARALLLGSVSDSTLRTDASTLLLSDISNPVRAGTCSILLLWMLSMSADAQDKGGMPLVPFGRAEAARLDPRSA